MVSQMGHSNKIGPYLHENSEETHIPVSCCHHPCQSLQLQIRIMENKTDLSFRAPLVQSNLQRVNQDIIQGRRRQRSQENHITPYRTPSTTYCPIMGCLVVSPSFALYPSSPPFQFSRIHQITAVLLSKANISSTDPQPPTNYSLPSPPISTPQLNESHDKQQNQIYQIPYHTIQS